MCLNTSIIFVPQPREIDFKFFENLEFSWNPKLTKVLEGFTKVFNTIIYKISNFEFVGK